VCDCTLEKRRKTQILSVAKGEDIGSS
jgi:hypothetical protein